MFYWPLIVSGFGILLMGMYTWLTQMPGLSDQARLAFIGLRQLAALFYFVALLFASQVIVPKEGNEVVTSKSNNYMGLIAVVVYLLGYMGLLKKYPINPKPDNMNVVPASHLAMAQAYQNFDKQFTVFGLFVLFLVLLYITNPGGIVSNPKILGPSMFLIIFIGLIMARTLLLAGSAAESSSRSIALKAARILVSLVLSGGLLFGMLYWMGMFDQDAKNPSKWLPFVLNLTLLLVMFGVLFRLANANGEVKQSPLYKAALTTALYIPCLFTNTLYAVYSRFGKPTTTAAATPSSWWTNLKITSAREYAMLASSVGLIGTYFLMRYVLAPMAAHRYYMLGGVQLINEPIPTNVQTNISSYQTLNEVSDERPFTYQYALSFWFYLDSFAPNTNASYNKVVPIVSYGDNPLISYSAPANTLYITMQKGTDNQTELLFEQKDVLLQKWNHVVINVDGGTMDVFYNGELVKSAVEVVPYLKYDMLTVGTEGGVSGNVSNMVYFKHPLSLPTIVQLYERTAYKRSPEVGTVGNPSRADSRQGCRAALRGDPLV